LQPVPFTPRSVSAQLFEGFAFEAYMFLKAFGFYCFSFLLPARASLF